MQPTAKNSQRIAVSFVYTTCTDEEQRVVIARGYDEILYRLATTDHPLTDELLPPDKKTTT